MVETDNPKLMEFNNITLSDSSVTRLVINGGHATQQSPKLIGTYAYQAFETAELC